MLAIIPILFVALLFVTAAGRCGLRQGFVYASAIYTLCVVCATEFLSIFAWLKFETVLAFWSSMTTLAAVWLWRSGTYGGFRQKLRSAASYGLSAKLLLAAAAFVLSIVLVIALVSPPNNWESMAYRLMRVAMWIDQQSVAHYPTANIVQIYYSPLVSWQALHLQLLASDDRFANMPEWIALVGCAVVASLIAKELRARFSVQVVAAVVAVTLPMGILQGSSTAANLSGAYWLLSFFLLFIQHLRQPTLLRLACCGLALGFALLSKPTTYVIAPPLGLMLVLYGFFHVKPRFRSVLSMAGVGVVALTLNLGHYGRNWVLFDHPISPIEADSHINEQFNLSILASNMVRSAALHWGLPSGDVLPATAVTAAILNAAVLDAVEAVFGSAGGERGIYITARFNEVDTPNFLHFWLLAISVVGLLWRRRHVLEHGPLTIYLVSATALSAVFFCAVIRWSQYDSSYHVPLFMLGAPLVAMFFSPTSRAVGAAPTRGREWPLWAVSTTLLLASTPWLLFKESAPLLRSNFSFSSIAAEPIFSAQRERAYFNHIGGRGWPTHADFVQLLDFVTSLEPAVVGLYEREEPGQYTAWFQAYAIYMMLQERLDDVSAEYFGVANRTARLQRNNRVPSVILLRSYWQDSRNLDALGGVIAERVAFHPAHMEVWRPATLFGGTLRTFDMAQLEPERRRLACDEIHRQAGPSKAFFLVDQLVYLSRTSAAAASAACGQRERQALAESSISAGGALSSVSHVTPTERIVLHAALRSEDRPSEGAETAAGAARFEFRAQDFRGSFGAFAFDVPPQAASVSVVELDSDGRVTWEMELNVPAGGGANITPPSEPPGALVPK